MRAAIIFTLVALAVARPTYESSEESAEVTLYRDADSGESVELVRDDRVYPSAAGEYSLDFETSDGTRITESGYGSGPDGAVETQGSVRYVSPEGVEFELTYVADAAGGYQPESDALPVAPAFPHPIPQFVLDQIAFAAQEDARRAAAGSDEESAEEATPYAAEESAEEVAAEESSEEAEAEEPVESEENTYE